MKCLLAITFLLCFKVALAQVQPYLLSDQTQKRIERIQEFAFIKEEANKLGVKVYLFGGTASAFAHYVRWDLEREAGDEKYQAERFDYDFTNIYRGNQDLDIVVDGTAEQAAALQSILKEKYPHFVGSKDAWEVRLLRAEIGDKLPLLDNPDFLNQHTDTNSTGMIAVNADPGEIIFRDLFSWENPDSRFLNDVASGRIKFLFSESHETTTRFKEGKNPPVFAAIRYLAKLAQYEVDEAEGDLEIIKRIVEGANWSTIKNNEYVKHKLEEFGKKVLLNAPDSEYAWNLLEETGLRKRLIEMDGNRISSVESLSWWMNKEPLRTKPLGEGNGEAAAEIFKSHINEDGEIVVAHETSSFEAYENITRSSHGAANAFISRDGVSGEAAMLGDGFYTRLGVKGARGTNLTIRFKLNPSARAGEDFIYKDDFIVVKNKAALELIQENLNISIANFFKLIISNLVSENNKGLKEKLLRKFSRQQAHSFDEIQEAKELLADYFFIDEDLEALAEASDAVNIIRQQDSFKSLYNYFLTFNEDFIYAVESYLEEQEGHLKLKWIKTLVKKKVFNSTLIRHHLSINNPEHIPLITEIVEQGNDDIDLAKHIFSKTNSELYPHLLQKVIDRGNADLFVVISVLPSKRWTSHPEWIVHYLLAGFSNKLFSYAFSPTLKSKHWLEHPVLLDFLNDGLVTDLYEQVDMAELEDKIQRADFNAWYAARSQGLQCAHILQ